MSSTTQEPNLRPGAHSDPQGIPARVRPRFDPDSAHPGFHDLVYRARRDAIADLAWDHLDARHRFAAQGKLLEESAIEPRVPLVVYSDEEHALWRYLSGKLRGLAARRAARELIAASDVLDLPSEQVPQLRFVGDELHARAGIRMEPVPGLVEVEPFFAALADGVFLSTQYLRHPSRPDYTPEPDMVHELVGHAATLSIPRVAALHRRLGAFPMTAPPKKLTKFERLYWFTFEFGVVEEEGELRAVGAGLLSSAQELEFFDRDAVLAPWDVAQILATEYDTQRAQDRLFFARSFTALLDGFEAALDRV